MCPEFIHYLVSEHQDARGAQARETMAEAVAK